MFTGVQQRCSARSGRALSRFLLIGALTAAFIAGTGLAPSAAAVADDPADEPACVLTPETTEAALRSIAGPTTASWVASDGFSSVRLDDHRVLFVNHDTFWGTSDGANQMTGGSMICNSALIYDDRDPNCFTGLSGPNGTTLFTSPNVGQWMWPGNPTFNGQLLTLPMASMTMRDVITDNTYDFRIDHSELRSYTVAGNTLTPYGPVRLLDGGAANPPGAQFEWVGAFEYNEWVYLAPTYLRPGQWGHDIYLARIPTTVWFDPGSSPLLDHLQFKTTTGWRTGVQHHELDPVTWGTGGTMASMTAGGDEVHLLFKEYAIMSQTIVSYHAPTFDGPFTRTKIATAPLHPGTLSYWANTHTSLHSSGLSRKITVNYINAEDLGWGNLLVMDRYRPKMLEVILPETVRISTGRPNTTAAINVTVTGSNTSGFATAYPCSAGPGDSSTVNFPNSAPVANLALVKTDPAGDVCVTPTTGTHVVADITGVDDTATTTAPTRLLDTRLPSSPTAGAALQPGQTLAIPTDAPAGSVALLNVTTTGASGNGYTEVFPCDAPPDEVTTTGHYQAGQTRAIASAVGVDPSGNVCLRVHTSDVHVVVDTSGYTSGWLPSSPIRRLDTRLPTSPTAGAKVPAGGTVVVPTSAAGQTVVGSVTITTAEDRGFATVYPCGMPVPETSTVNFQAATNTSAAVFSGTDASGSVCVYTTATTHIVFDETAVARDATSFPPERLRDTRIQ